MSQLLFTLATGRKQACAVMSWQLRQAPLEPRANGEGPASTPLWQAREKTNCVGTVAINGTATGALCLETVAGSSRALKLGSWLVSKQ